MRIDKLILQNFKKFENASFSFELEDESSPNFHVFIGNNGAGKTSVLDAIAIGLGVWLEKVPDSLLDNSRRRLTADQKTMIATQTGDRVQPQQVIGDTSLQLLGQILEEDIEWGPLLEAGKKRVSNRKSKQALDLIWSAYKRSQEENVILPVIAYYGAGRAWLPHNQRTKAEAKQNGKSNRWEALYDCLNERIRLSDLNDWFRKEETARGKRGGEYRPGFSIVLQAVKASVPDVEDLYFDDELKQIVLTINGNPQPFTNLSAGQRNLFALFADIAVKIVTQNNFLVPADQLTEEEYPLATVLKKTPGVVLIDELDVHLHPLWQRTVAANLSSVFPSIQFITTTHSAQIVGELLPWQVHVLDENGVEQNNSQSFGMDSNWILKVLMGAQDQNAGVRSEVQSIFELIRNKDLEGAENKVRILRDLVGNSESIQRAMSTIERIRLLGK